MQLDALRTTLENNPSMKALPKRKGNPSQEENGALAKTLNESPSEKEGKWWHDARDGEGVSAPSMKALPKRKGNTRRSSPPRKLICPSMKALPKRKGNMDTRPNCRGSPSTLNESPSEKEGKFQFLKSEWGLCITPQ